MLAKNIDGSPVLLAPSALVPGEVVEVTGTMYLGFVASSVDGPIVSRKLSETKATAEQLIVVSKPLRILRPLSE